MKKISRFCRPGARVSTVCIVPVVCYSRVMSRIPGLKGMRHIALKVKDVARSKRFYQDVLGMDVVWEPDPQNVYLSSGCDNIAIHGVSEAFANTAEERQLDHLGFVVEDVERVRALENEFIAKGVPIVHRFKVHRDGSASFYCADPDGIIIQLLYEPQLSRQTIE
ncbi:MAG TPA: VOC family protein [Candidatus Binatia bacterium]|nr:VOC family protein [Candidatus Binatia bacterium]